MRSWTFGLESKLSGVVCNLEGIEKQELRPWTLTSFWRKATWLNQFLVKDGKGWREEDGEPGKGELPARE